jgi:CheY-like chemotaxis protein
MIETFGGQVAAEAGDGLTAISEFDRTHPDIVLMDITMPQMEGIEAAERIVQAASGSAHRHGFLGGLPGKHCRGVAARRTPFRAEAG